MSDDDPEDPFESFDTAEDRDGDPFERLDDAGPTGETGDETPAEDLDDETATDMVVASESTDVFEEEFIDEGDPFSTGPSEAQGSSAIDGADGDAAPEDDPFAGMADRAGDPFADDQGGFKSVDVESVDADEIWASLEEEPDQPTVEGSRYAEVSKHRFCEECEHFTSPPNAYCTHEEADIIEYLDMETVRLLNCPVVAEQRELENEE